jgi:hypothetical protein
MQNISKITHDYKGLATHKLILRTKEGYHRIWDCGHLKFNERKINNDKI